MPAAVSSNQRGICAQSDVLNVLYAHATRAIAHILPSSGEVLRRHYLHSHNLDAFEAVVAQLLRAKGLWVQTSVKVDLAKGDKRDIGNPSMPRPEIDIVAYCGRTNTLLALECKSFLDSYGVNYAELCTDAKDDSTYKMFRRQPLRDMVLKRLGEQMIRRGMCRPNVKVCLGLIAGKVYRNDSSMIKASFRTNGWFFRDARWLKREIKRLSGIGYENEVMTVVTKLLLRA